MEIKTDVDLIKKALADRIAAVDSGRFFSETLADKPFVLITDTETGKNVLVPIFATQEVLKALQVLFEKN